MKLPEQGTRLLQQARQANTSEIGMKNHEFI
jgi:hypothetical protein